MPELPEVEIIKQSLKKTVLFKQINQVLVKNRNLRFKIQNNFQKKLKNKKITKVERRSKYLIFHLNKSQYLIIHFGMSGTLHLLKNFDVKLNLVPYSDKMRLEVCKKELHALLKD